MGSGVASAYANGFYPDISGTAAQLAEGYIGNALTTAIDLANQATETIGEISLGDTSVSLTVPTLDVPLTDIDTSIPVPPTLISPVPDISTDALSFNYQEDIYVSNLLNKLIDTLLNGLLYAGTGLKADVENEMLAYESELDAMVNQTALSDASARCSGTGLPDEFLNANLSMISVNYENTKMDKGRQIAEIYEKLSIDNMRFMIGEAGKLESLLMEYASRRWDRKFLVAKGLVDAIGMALSIAVSKYMIISGGNDARASVYAAQVGAQASSAKGQEEVKGAVLRVQADIAQMQGRIAQILSGLVEREANARMEITKMAGNAAANMAAGAMTGAHASAGISYGESKAESTSEGAAKVEVFYTD